VLSYVLAFAGFAVLVILHEAGHYCAAKAVGMRVERFALFFPPLLLKFRRGETEYGIGCIPLGGYVKITGMSPREKIAPELEHRAYYRQAVWKRVVVIVAGPVVNIVLAFAILWALVAIDGVSATVPVVGSVTRDSAAVGRLHAGDEIVSVDGRAAGAPGLGPDASQRRVDRVQQTVSRHACAGGARTAGCRATTPVRLEVLRGGHRRAVTVTPRYDAQLRRPLMGLQFESRQFGVGVGSAASRGLSTMWTIASTTVHGIVRLFYDASARRQVSGIVGSYEVVRESFRFDVVRAITLLAVISLSLGIVNLFPVLPLDGGHIFWAVAEKLRGRPISFRIVEYSTVVGFALVAFLFIVGLHADIGRLTSGEGFGVR
jgi:regulator of sigma E protease